MKRVLSLFLALSILVGGLASAEILDTGKDGVLLPVIIPNLTGNAPDDVIEFVEVREDNSVSVQTQPVNTIGVYQPVVFTPTKPKPSYRQEVARKPVKDYLRLYGAQYFSPLYSDARVHDWAELDGRVARSYYSDSQRSSRVNAYYGKLARLRYYPSLRRPSRELAGVFEHDAKLLTP